MKKVLIACAALVIALFAVSAAFAGKTPEALKPVEAVGTFMNDAATTAEVTLRLVGEKGMDSSGITVTTVDSVVELDGVVENAAQSEAAERIARSISNVKGVKNNLGIRR